MTSPNDGENVRWYFCKVPLAHNGCQCFPVYWNGENLRVLRGHWFAQKAGLDWLPLREDVSEQLEFAYGSQVKVLTACQTRKNDDMDEGEENSPETEERSYGSVMMEKLTGDKEGRIDHVLQGIIEESKLNSFNMPHYLPSIDEVKAIVQAEGSFTVDTLDTVDVRWTSTDSNYLDSDYGFDMIKIGLATAKHIRAAIEPILTSHFGAEVIDDIFIRQAAYVAEHLETETSKHCMLAICMTKKE